MEMFDRIVEKTKMFFKREQTIDNMNNIIYSYLFFSYEEFEKIKSPLKYEMRGITINDNGIFPAIQKFFNIEETPEAIKWEDLETASEINIVEKLDGSMISPIIVNDKLFLKSKFSLKSEHAVISNKLLSIDQKEIVKDLIRSGYYPQFEYISPKNKIVVPYEKDELRLVAVRKKYNDGFININLSELENFADEIGIKSAKLENISLNKLKEIKQKATGIEGFVIYCDDKLTKLKTDWYIRQHKLSLVNVNEKIIFDLVINEEIDDALSSIDDGDIKRIISNYSNKIINFINDEIQNAIKLKSEFDKIGKKEFALKYPKYRKYITSFYRLPVNYTDDDIKKIVIEDLRNSNKKLTSIINNFGKLK